ncbi:MAG: amidophosphoribosyltransferase [Dictyoglomus sp. NZ13-RE01]|nr:MAG: amidophosphoribosyltransferase [Dictyoglomus sp. NZ13-RE01]
MSIYEECGIAGAITPSKYNLSSFLVYNALLNLQHRGQESAGIVSFKSSEPNFHKDYGLVSNVFNNDILKKLRGKISIGHVRYSTSGKQNPNNIQPLIVNLPKYGFLALAHNGHIANANFLRKKLENEGAIFQSTSDTEVIFHLMARAEGKNLEERLMNALNHVDGSYALLIASNEGIWAVKDPNGFRPLFMAVLEDGSILFSSETCAFKNLPVKSIKELERGDLIFVSSEGEIRESVYKIGESRFCLFEFIYFSRPDSLYNGKSVYNYRKDMGRILAKESYVPADIVVPVPDSGIPAAIGFSEFSGIPLEMALMRSHYVGRTFIQPRQDQREGAVRIKLLIMGDVVKNKRVILVDDSLVRGTTAKRLAEMFRKEGAKEVHLRLSSPPIIYPCHYGVDIPHVRELISHYYTPDEIAKLLGFDSVAFLSMEGLLSILPNKSYCGECFGRKVVSKELCQKELHTV